MPLPSGLQKFSRKINRYLYGVLLYMTLSVKSCCFRNLFKFAILIIIYLDVWGFWVHLVCDPLCFLYPDICFLLQVFSHNLSNTFSTLFLCVLLWGPLYCECWCAWCCSRSPLNCSFLFILFPVPSIPVTSKLPLDTAFSATLSCPGESLMVSHTSRAVRAQWDCLKFPLSGHYFCSTTAAVGNF